MGCLQPRALIQLQRCPHSRQCSTIAGLATRLAAADDKYHGRIPKIAMLQERNVRAGFFDDVSIASVIAQLPAALQPVIRFAYVTGWRVQSEVLPLKWRQVDRKAGEARLEPGTTKNQAGRVFPFTDTLRELIEALWAEHQALQKAETICPYVFHRNGRRIKSLRGAWTKPALRPAIPECWCTTCGGRPSGTWSGAACRGAWRCS